MSSEYFSSISGSTNSASSTVNNNSNNACTSTRWLTEEVFALIDLVQRNEAIYNPRHKYYFCRPYVENFWREVDLKLEKNPGASLAKWTNLRISFRREYTNYLEEKVPPCWTYFDRMFFLHPYLRKKHQQSKSLDSQVQDALVQISSLSNRLQRERAEAAAAAANSITTQSNEPSPSQPQLDHYLEYFDEAEPNASELDDMIDDEPTNPQHFAHSTLASDIKSECEDNVDEYDNVERPLDEDDHEVDDADMRSFVLNSLEKRQQQQQQHQQRLQHLQRLQSRGLYEDFRNKRARSHENITSSQTSGPSLLASSSSSIHSNNVSFVRPTFAKPIEVVSTTSQSHSNNNNNSSNNSNNSNSSTSSSVLNNDNEPVSNSTPRLNSSTHNPHHSSSSSHYSSTLSHSHSHHHQQRFEISAINSATTNSSLNSVNPPLNSGSNTASSLVAPAPSATPELCDCKTDPDAMFLMSLLPDIQKLNGRDRGKIKIAFQNILQDYLYPD